MASEAAQEHQIDHVFNAAIEGHPPRVCNTHCYLLTHLDVPDDVTELFDRYSRFGLYTPQSDWEALLKPRKVCIVAQLGYLNGVVVVEDMTTNPIITAHNFITLRDGRVFVRNELTDRHYYTNSFEKYLSEMSSISRRAATLFNDERLEELVRNALEQKQKKLAIKALERSR